MTSLGADHVAGPESHPIEVPERIEESGFRKAHASPGVRAFARELGIDLAQLQGSGPSERILRDDVQAFVRRMLGEMSAATSAASVAGNSVGGAMLPWPKIDFARFGPINIVPLSRIRKPVPDLARNGMTIPHVTQHDDADVTSLEAFRVQVNQENEKSGARVTMLAFLIKAVVSALKRFPDFNASLDGDQLVHKQYFHIGFAADTPNGLVVPVIRNADRKGVVQLALEISALSESAREGKLGAADVQGGCFSISSLGGIGGSYFTPIINAPEVAILGVGRAQMKPAWDGEKFEPRLMLPLSLSYDHRVIDGAAAARFVTCLGSVLADFRRTIL